MAAPAATAAVRRCSRLADGLLGVRRRCLHRASTDHSTHGGSGPLHSTSDPAAVRRCCRVLQKLLGLAVECCGWHKPVLAAVVVASGLTATGEGRRPTSDPRLLAEMLLSLDLEAAMTAAREGDERRADALLEAALLRAQRAGARAGVLAALDVRATLAQRRGDAAQAERLARDGLAFALYSLRLPRDHPEVLCWVLKLARLYSEQRRLEEAEQAFQRCEALCRPHVPPSCLPALDHSRAVLWVSVLFWHGLFLAQQQRFSEAAARLEESFRAALCAPAAATSPEQRLVILFHLADALQQLGRHTDAIRYLQNAVSLDCDSSNSDLATCCVKLGKLLALTGQEEAAASFCEKGRRLAARARDSSLVEEAGLCLRSLPCL